MMRLFMFALLFVLLWPAHAVAVVPHDASLRLRVELDMHSLPIRAAAVDASGRYLVTGSDDKTIRIWDLRKGGTLLRTLRPPIGPDFEGRILAVAISPDGATIAASGWTASSGDAHRLLLFERATGWMQSQQPLFATPPTRLVFTPDGRGLLATLSGTQGLVLVDLEEGKIRATASGYQATPWGLSVSRSGQVLTASEDGLLKLYDEKLKLLKSARAPAALPHAVAFSPDGRRFAVGYAGDGRVGLQRTSDMAELPLSSPPVARGAFLQVAWSADGETLFAGGTARDTGGRVILRRWNLGSEGPAVDETASTDTLLDLVPLPNGGVVATAADPWWGVFRSDEGWKPSVHAPVARILGGRDFLTNDDGNVVEFVVDDEGHRNRLRFSLQEGMLSQVTASDPGLFPALAFWGTNGLDGWEEGDPRLMNKPLARQPHEPLRAYAFLPAGQGLVVGSEWFLRGYDLAANPRWSPLALPAPVRGLTVSGDGQQVLAALADGSIRWYSAVDGMERLAFFLHADQSTWVVWTPENAFETSPGGEALLGWHLQRTAGQGAEFLTLSTFEEDFRQPGVGALALNGGMLQEVDQVAQALPATRLPAPQILSPRPGDLFSSHSIALELQLPDLKGAELEAVRIFADGELLQTELRPTRRIVATPGISAPSARALSIQVTVPERDHQLQVQLLTGAGVSDFATVPLIWKMPAPNLYLLSIGVGEYQNDLYDTLQYADDDAIAIVEAFKKQDGRMYQSVSTRLLVNADATRDNILDGLEWLERSTTGRDVAALFIAGHGVKDPRSGQYQFLPYEADPEFRRRTFLAETEIQTTLSSITGQRIVFMDTCHAGEVLGGALRGEESDLSVFVGELAQAEPGIVIFAAATGNQSSQERKEWGHGAFTLALLEGLSGQADYRSTGRVTHKMLDLYVSERVKALTDGLQTPTYIGGTGDFPLAEPR